MDNKYTYEFDELKPGTILVCSWGYTMTLVDFYRVSAIWGKCHVTLDKLRGKIVKGDGFCGELVPTDEKIDRITNVFYSKKFRCAKFDNRKFLRIWDGKPVEFDNLD